MSEVENLFNKLNADLAPGQEKRINVDDIEFKGEILTGDPVDFSTVMSMLLNPSPVHLIILFTALKKSAVRSLYGLPRP